MMTVPMLDLSLQHAQVAEEIRAGFERVVATSSYILGPAVGDFETAFAEYCGVGHAIGVGTGTDAIELALRGAGIGPGDDVILPANTFVATAEAVLRAGATVVFADCDEDFLLDPQDLRTRMTSRTRAVIAVHLYGQTAAIDEIRAVAGPSVVLVEDAAQAQGARYQGRRAGSLGDVAGTSFYPGKNLGAYGDGGAVLTASDAIAERVRMLRNHGGLRKYEHREVGTNSRLDSLQAVVLSAKLGRLDSWNAERRQIAERYAGVLSALPQVICPRTVPGNEHVYHQYVVRVPERDRVLAELIADGIGAGIHYPVPVPLLPAFAGPVPATGCFPVAERLANEILSLPIYPGLTPEQQDYVAERLVQSIGHTATVVSGTRAAG